MPFPPNINIPAPRLRLILQTAYNLKKFYSFPSLNTCAYELKVLEGRYRGRYTYTKRIKY